MTVLHYTDTVAGRVMAAAVRPNGVISSDIETKRLRVVTQVTRELVAAGHLVRIGTTMPYRHAATAAMYAAWEATKQNPKRPGPKPRGGVLTVHIAKQGRPPQRKGWGKDDPPHLPYDDAGRPLFKVTLCPGFTGEPRKTNTFTGAY